MVEPAAYSATQKSLHWLIAAMVFILIPVGFYMVERGEATQFDALTNQLYTAHKTFGFLLLWLVVLRILIRLRRGVPAPEASLNGVQRIASSLVHGLMYLALLAVPLLGWAGVSAYPARGILFGLSLPPILGVNQKLAEEILEWHGTLALTMLALVAVHIGAALFHKVILKDGVFNRMMPSGKKS